MPPPFAVCITTLNRRDVFTTTLDAYRRHTPAGIPILVVDDGSDIPVPNADHRNPTPQGVAAAKNASLTLLMNTGADRLLLSDDDVYPTTDNWWHPFVNTDHPHVIYQPTTTRRCQRCRREAWHIYGTINGRYECSLCGDKTVRPTWKDSTYFAIPWGAGVLYSITRPIVERVGGMREEFGRWSAETWEYSYRIVNCGFGTHPFISPITADMHALDTDLTVRVPSVSHAIRAQYRERNWKLFQRYKDSRDFVPYTQPHVAVCIPRRDTLDRVDAHEKCAQWWTAHGYPISFGDSDPNQPFHCASARNNAVAHCNTNKPDILVIADADTIPDSVEQIRAAANMVMATEEPLVVYPYQEFRHIDKTWATKPGDQYRRAPIQQAYPDSPGGIWVMRPSTFALIGGFDEQFAAGLAPNGSCFGYDDTAFRIAAETFATVKRIPGVAWSFNHATKNGKPERPHHDPDNPNLSRYQLYQAARGNPDMMRALR